MKHRLKYFAMFLVVIHVANAQEIKQYDCTDTNCPPLRISGDAPAELPGGRPSPFRGFADACMRFDPTNKVLWMAYSYPYVRIQREGCRRHSQIGVETHLARSLDKGNTWDFAKVLWAPIKHKDSKGVSGHISHEVANIIPVTIDGKSAWIGARLNYFMPDEGGFKARPPQSFHISVMTATSPETLSDAQAVRLGSKSTDEEWRDIDISLLSPTLQKYHLWNEPALYYDGQILYMMLSGMAFHRKEPDPSNSDIVLFSTTPKGNVHDWKWEFVGVVASRKEAEELGCKELNQGEIAVSRNGNILLLVTPSRWDRTINDFVYDGCRVLEFDSLNPPKLLRHANGQLVRRASITSSDAGSHGTAASAYDHNSATGVILGKRTKTAVGSKHGDGGGAEMTATLHPTGIHP